MCRSLFILFGCIYLLRNRDRVGDHHHSLRVAFWRPARDDRQPRLGGFRQVGQVRLLLGGVGVQHRQQQHPVHLVLPAVLSGLQGHFIAGLEFPQVLEDRAVHVVVAVQDDVSACVGQPAGHHPPHCRAGGIPFGAIRLRVGWTRHVPAHRHHPAVHSDGRQADVLDQPLPVGPRCQCLHAGDGWSCRWREGDSRRGRRRVRRWQHRWLAGGGTRVYDPHLGRR